MKIIFLDAGTTDIGDVDFSHLKKLGDLKLFDFTTKEEAGDRIKEADVLIVNKFKVDAAVVAQASKLKYIVVAATGYNNIDLEAVRQASIPVSNVRGYSTSSVAQQVFASLLHVLNRPNHYMDAVHSGRWEQSRDFCFLDHSIEELEGKNLGIAGFGNIGRRMAAIGKAFGMNIFLLQYKNAEQEPLFQSLPVEEFFRKSDVISLHLPLNAMSSGFINAHSLGLMKSKAILINTGRGGLINEAALYNHLVDSPDFTAILDVLSTEPPTSGNPLIGLPNCYITPHIAWASKQARQQLIIGIENNIRNFLDGNWINNIY